MARAKKVPYHKPPTSFREQVDILIGRGLNVPDKKKQNSIYHSSITTVLQLTVYRLNKTMKLISL